MSTTASDAVIPAEDLADAQVVADCLASGTPIPVDVARRIHDRSAVAKAELLRTRGIQDIGVKIIRELRGELPNP